MKIMRKRKHINRKINRTAQRLGGCYRSGVLAVLAFWPTWRDLQSGFRAGADLAGAVLARIWPFWRPPRSGDGVGGTSWCPAGAQLVPSWCPAGAQLVPAGTSWYPAFARLGISPERLRNAISSLKDSRQIGQTLARLAPPDWRPAGARLGAPPERESPPD